MFLPPTYVYLFYYSINMATPSKKEKANTYTVSERNFNRQEWDYLTRQRDPHTKAVTAMLRNVGEQIGETGKYVPEFLNVKTFGIDGNKYLEAVRPAFLENFGSLFTLKTTKGKVNILDKVDFGEKKVDLDKVDKKKKKSKVKHGKGQALKLKIKMETVKKSIDQDCETMKNITFEHGIFPLTNNFSNIEFRLLSFMMWAVYEKIKMLKKKGEQDKYYESVVSLSHGIKSFETIKKYVGDTEVKTSIESLLIDANYILQFARKDSFSMSHFLLNYGRLITKTKYDEAYLTTIIQPYDNQTQVLNLLNDAIKKDEPCLIRYKTPPGSGKTCLAVAIGALLAKTSTKILIYTCYNNIVRQDVGNQLHISGVPFAVVSSNSIRPVRLCYGGIKHRNMGAFKASLPEDPLNSLMIQDVYFKKPEICPNPPKVLICDLMSAQTFMNFPDVNEKFVAFLDEPTVGAENGPTNDVCITYTKIMKYLPKQSFLVSATMPRFDEIQPVINNWTNMHNADEKENCHDVTSTKLGIGCKAIDPEGYVVAPHNLVNSVADLEKLLEHLKQNPFLLRFYTSDILMDMIEKVPDIFNVDDCLGDIVHDVSHDNIRNLSLKVIQHICEQQNEELIKVLTKKTRKVRKVGFDIDTALTSSASDHIGSILYVSSNPAEDIERMSKELFDGAPNLDRAYTKYIKDLDDYRKTIEKIEKSVKQEEKQRKEKDRLAVPELHWPSEFVVNTREHLKKFSVDANVDKTMIKHGHLDVPRELFDTVSSPYDKLLVSRIGLYNPADTKLNANGSYYTNIVNQYASEGQLATIASDEQIVYGTNYPLTGVTIEANFGKKSSPNTIGQLIGRAGRTGKSETATVTFTDYDTLVKAFTNCDTNVEANAICQVMVSIST